MKYLKHVSAMTALTVFAVAGAVYAADNQRQAEVERRGADVMPFNLKGTTHSFTKTEGGGIQRVIVNNPADTQQVMLVREHLRTIQRQFANGDFSGPTHIHGASMPGLAILKAAKPGQVDIQYKDVPAGAELSYHSADKKVVSALHDWFDAQLSDHGAHAMGGHDQ